MGGTNRILELSCPQCAISVTEGREVTLQGQVRRTLDAGAFRLSAVFGDYQSATDLAVADGDIVDFRCPHCGATVMIPRQCKLCGAPMASLDLARGGYVEFCSRRGCRAHALGGTGDLDDILKIGGIPRR